MGEYLHTLDKKGRLILPARFREVLSGKYIDKLVVTIGLDNCLYAYPPEEWKVLENKLRSLSKADANARFYMRALLANAGETIIDKQGRISIPPALRTKAGITQSVIVVGVLDCIEIWSKEKWLSYINQPDKPIEGVAQQLANMGI